MDLPAGLDLSRHRDLEGRQPGLWIRRVILILLVAFLAAALLNVFGQTPSTSTAQSSAATLKVTSPARVRGGLLYQARIQIQAHKPIQNLNLVMNQGWFDQTTVNAIEPQPSNESSDSHQIKLSFGQLGAGQTLLVYVYFQVNPTNIGSHDTGVSVADGSTPLVSVSRSQFNFP
jgi:hypothetical protein